MRYTAPGPFCKNGPLQATAPVFYTLAPRRTGKCVKRSIRIGINRRCDAAHVVENSTPTVPRRNMTPERHAFVTCSSVFGIARNARKSLSDSLRGRDALQPPLPDQ